MKCRSFSELNIVKLLTKDSPKTFDLYNLTQIDGVNGYVVWNENHTVFFFSVIKPYIYLGSDNHIAKIPTGALDTVLDYLRKLTVYSAYGYDFLGQIVHEKVLSLRVLIARELLKRETSYV